MENSSVQKSEVKKINVFLGEETKYMELPPRRVGDVPKKFIVHPLIMSDIAKIESFSGIDFIDWAEKNPLSKLSVLMYALWLSICKNDKLDYTQDQFNNLFRIADSESMFKLLKVILDISGLDQVQKEKVEEKVEEKKEEETT